MDIFQKIKKILSFVCNFKITKEVKFDRKKFIKWGGSISWFVLGMIAGMGGIILWYCFSGTNLKKQETYDPWQITYYFFQVLGTIGTLLAVVVALAKEAIMKWLYSPTLEVSLINEGITENIDNENQRVPEANSFECYANIENCGSLAALGCKIFISDVKFGKSKSNLKSINSLKNKQLKWTSVEVDMPIGIPSRIRLFEIVNPNSMGTPQDGLSKRKSRISFNGCELKSHYLEKGVWVFDYFITCKNGEVSKFGITIEWNGEFKSRATDMADVLKVQIEKK